MFSFVRKCLDFFAAFLIEWWPRALILLDNWSDGAFRSGKCSPISQQHWSIQTRLVVVGVYIVQRGSSYEISHCPVITLEAHTWTRYKEGGNTWTDIQYILSDFKNTGLRMSSHYKQVEIKDILNPLTSESSEGTNSQKPTDEALHSKTKK